MEQLKQDNSKSAAEWEKKVAQVRAQIEDAVVEAKKFGYEDVDIKDAAGKVVYHRPAIEELIRWRLWDRTGGGLMAELGSHQLDAASIFIAAVHGGQKQHPLNVAAAADRPLFPPDRDVEDHVYCIFEFPAPGYDAEGPDRQPQEDRRALRLDQRQRLRRLRRNGLRHRGHAAAGDREGRDALPAPTRPPSKTKVVPAKGRQEGHAGLAGRRGRRSRVGGHRHARRPARRSRLYRGVGALGLVHPQPRPENQPRCHPKVALGDAVIALTTNMAARQGRADRVQEGVVRHPQRRDARRRQAGSDAV